jgi:peptidoglycan/xylan/chitin deacetylase (PgdA/CDA1 family)
MTVELLVLMYHYVRSPDMPGVDGLHGPLVEEFERQLRKVQSRYHVLDYQSLLAGLHGDEPLAPKNALITFDDGTTDHYHNAFPVLRRLGLSGLFFLITDAVESRRLVAVHARHIIAGQIGEEQLRVEFTQCLCEHIGSSDWLAQVPIEVAMRAYRWDDQETARFKYAVNFHLPSALRNTILQQIFEHRVGDWRAWGDRFYLTWEQAREMQALGMAVGGHSHRHEALALQEPQALEADIRQCFDLLSRQLGTNALPFSYPFGKAEHVSRAVIDVLEQAGCTVAFTNIQGGNHLPLQASGPARYMMLRIDPKDLQAA